MLLCICHFLLLRRQSHALGKWAEGVLDVLVFWLAYQCMEEQPDSLRQLRLHKAM